MSKQTLEVGNNHVSAHIEDIRQPCVLSFDTFWTRTTSSCSQSQTATNADLNQPAVPTFLSSASDRFFLGLGFENGAQQAQTICVSVIVNPQYLQILGAEYTNRYACHPTHVKRIALYPKDHDAFLRRGVYHSDESLTGPDFDGEVISGTISTAGTGYGTNTGVSFTTSGGSGRGSGLRSPNTNGGVINPASNPQQQRPSTSTCPERFWTSWGEPVQAQRSPSQQEAIRHFHSYCYPQERQLKS